MNPMIFINGNLFYTTLLKSTICILDHNKLKFLCILFVKKEERIDILVLFATDSQIFLKINPSI